MKADQDQSQSQKIKTSLDSKLKEQIFKGMQAYKILLHNLSWYGPKLPLAKS
jgi:hypothetical protein